MFSNKDNDFVLDFMDVIGLFMTAKFCIYARCNEFFYLFRMRHYFAMLFAIFRPLSKTIGSLRRLR